MNFQELTNIWNSADKQLDKAVSINKELIKEVSTNRIKSHLYEIKLTSMIEVFINFFWSIFLIRFIFGHTFDYRFIIPATALLIAALFSLILDVYKLSLYFGINARFSVVKTQKQLERLRYLELLGINSLYIIIPLFSLPFLIVVTKAFLNIDIYSIEIIGKVFTYYTIGSFVVAFILVFILKKYPNKNLKESIAFLNDLNETEKSN